MTVRLTGLGLIFFAVALAIEIVGERQPTGILLIPALCWIGAVLHLIPDDKLWQQLAIRIWALAAIPIFILTLINLWFSLIAISALLTCVVLIASQTVEKVGVWGIL